MRSDGKKHGAQHRECGAGCVGAARILAGLRNLLTGNGAECAVRAKVVERDSDQLEPVAERFG